MGVLLPGIQTYYGVNKGTVGFLFLAATTGYLFAAFSSGILVEKFGQRRFLMLGPAAIILGGTALTFLPPFNLALLAFLSLGLGVAVIDAGLNSFFANFPKNASRLNYLHAFYGVGALLGPIVATFILGSGFGWNTIYTLWFGLSLALLINFFFVYNSKDQASRPVKEASSGRGDLFPALKLKATWLGALFLFFYVGVEVSLGNWSYSYLIQERQVAPGLASWTISAYWGGLTLGRFVLAALSEKLGPNRLIEMCLGLMVTGTLITWLFPSDLLALLGLSLTGFSLGPIFPTTIALLSRLVPNKLVASAIGFVASLASMGAALFPWLAGNLAQAVGLWIILPYAIGLSVVMLFLWIAFSRRPASPVVLNSLE